MGQMLDNNMFLFCFYLYSSNKLRNIKEVFFANVMSTMIVKYKRVCYYACIKQHSIWVVRMFVILQIFVFWSFILYT
jgi:hypothetical protein